MACRSLSVWDLDTIGAMPIVDQILLITCWLPCTAKDPSDFWDHCKAMPVGFKDQMHLKGAGVSLVCQILLRALGLH